MSTKLKRQDSAAPYARLRPVTAKDDGALARYRAMLDAAPINVIWADKECVIRYLNAASVRTLETIEHLLPVKASQVVGQSIDIFHKHPEHQRRILADPGTCRTRR